MTGPTKGDILPPYLSPPTPNSEFASLMKEVAEREAEAGVKFKIIETAGLSMRRVLQVSNPLESAGCTSPSFLPCKNGRGEL